MTAAWQNSTMAPNPTQRAKGMTVRSQCEITSNIIVAVIRMQPINMQTNAIIHSDSSSDLKQTCGLLYKVIHDHMRPSLVSPPTSVMIQSGMAILIMAEISASRNSIPEMIVNLSIFLLRIIVGRDWDDGEFARRSEHNHLPPYLRVVTIRYQFVCATWVSSDDSGIVRNRHPRMCHPLLAVADS